VNGEKIEKKYKNNWKQDKRIKEKKPAGKRKGRERESMGE
jgi:hypothetical protein